MKKIIIPVVIISLILVAVILVMHYQIINPKKIVDRNYDTDNQIEDRGKIYIKIEPATFCLYNSLPIYNEAAENILMQIPAKRNRDPSSAKQIISFSRLMQLIELKEPYFLRIGRDGITIDQIDHFLITENWAAGTAYLDFAGKNERANKEGYVYIINIDKDFLKNNRVKLNTLQPLNDSDREARILAEAVSYLKTNSKEILFAGAKEKIDDLKQVIVNNYQIRLYQVGEMPVNKFFIASFEPNQVNFPFARFSFLYVNEKISSFGYFWDYLSFSIDSQWYLGFTNCVVLSSGYVGKVLISLENDSLKQVVADYSRAD